MESALDPVGDGNSSVLLASVTVKDAILSKLSKGLYGLEKARDKCGTDHDVEVEGCALQAAARVTPDEREFTYSVSWRRLEAEY